MPLYEYKCSHCGDVTQEVRPERSRNRKKPCSCEQGSYERVKFPVVNSTDMDFAKPVLSDSMGVHPSQVKEHRRMHPDIPITDDGRVICSSHNERKRIMKSLGFFDKDSYY